LQPRENTAAQPGEVSASKVKITVFANTVSTHSIDRYVRELVRNFPQTVEAKAIYFHPSSGGIRQQIDRYWGYIQLARREQGDYNIIASEGCAYLLMGLPGARTICVCHDMHALSYSGPKDLHHHLYDLRYRWNLRFLPKARFVVTVSQNTRTELLRFCPFIPGERVIPVHNGLEERWKRITSPELLDRYRILHKLKGKRAVLHVGSDVFYKNKAGVVRAFAQLNRPDLLLVLVGDLTRETEVLIDALGIRESVRQLNNLNDEDLVILYNLADVLVFPSISEGFGWPPLEAMACGCPVVASNAGSLPEICGDACIYVRATDVDQIAEAIERVLAGNDLRESLIRRGQLQAAKFSWKSTAAEFLDLFKR
jgi:glycosyltransferase involved in cell wall biosynthesis